MGRIVCGAKGTHRTMNFVRNIYCSLDHDHTSRHISSWDHTITDEWVEGEHGEIGGQDAGTYFDWSEPEPFDSDTLQLVNWFKRMKIEL